MKSKNVMLNIDEMKVPGKKIDPNIVNIFMDVLSRLLASAMMRFRRVSFSSTMLCIYQRVSLAPTKHVTKKKTYYLPLDVHPLHSNMSIVLQPL